MSDGYGTVMKTPEFHFEEGYTGTFEMPEESRKALDELMRQHDADAEKFFDIFENDVLCCMRARCDECYLDGKDGCQEILEDNVRRMIDNQKRMMIAFNKQRQEKK